MARLEQTKHLSWEEHSHCVSDTLIVKMTARFTCVVLDCQHYGPSIAITPLNTELHTPFSGLAGVPARRFKVVAASVWIYTG